jgi:hypothetical protein
MSDRLDALFASLRGQAPPAPFAAAAAVRRRGRQRALRQAATAGVAVLAVAGLGTGGLVTLSGTAEPPPPPAASSPGPTGAAASPAPTAIAEDMFLTTTDLGPGDWQRQASHELLSGGWWWACPALSVEEVPSLWLRVEADAAFWTGGDPADPAGSGQIIELFEPGAAEGNLDDVRTAVRVCTEGPPAAELVAPVAHEVVDEGFAGDESLLVRTEQYFYDGERLGPDPHLTLVAVVRVGELVTTLTGPFADAGDELPPGAEDHLRELAARAADRLR